MRGLHYQKKPNEETKIVRCTQGIIFDVAVDLRPDSQTYAKWYGLELTPENGKALYIPKGFAHGFITLADATTIQYFISDPYVPSSSCGIRWNDPSIGIQWPLDPKVINQRDSSFPDIVT